MSPVVTDQELAVITMLRTENAQLRTVLRELVKACAPWSHTQPGCSCRWCTALRPARVALGPDNDCNDTRP